MKFGVVVFPGSNCDQDLIDAIKRNTDEDAVRLWHKDTDLQGCDFVFLPGGFSYGDYLRSGALARFSPIMKSVADFASKGGYVMGICNGFQILCEAGLLPGALLRNNNQKFICSNVFITPQNHSLVTQAIPDGKALCIPIAHGEGRYYADEQILAKLNANNQIIFRYCDADGQINEGANPNGALENIAGICNEGRNVFGMMPHPERAADNILYNTDGSLLFQGILKAVQVA